MSDSSPTQGHSNDIPRTEYYSLDELEGTSQKMRRRHRVDDRLIESVLRAGSVLSEREEKTPRVNGLLRHRRFNKKFRDTDHFSMSILDLHTESYAHHKAMATLLERCLAPSVKHTLDGGIRPEGKVWVVHIFCYDLPIKRLNPLTLSAILLDSLLAQLSTKPSTRDQDWGLFEVTHEPIRPENSRMRDYQRCMEFLQTLVYRILEKNPENTIQFVFTGIMCTELGHCDLHELACFFIDMARLVRTVFPLHGGRMVKCVFCGDGLLDFSYLFDYLDQHKKRIEEGSDEAKAEIEELFAKILMLEWNIHESIWDEQDLVSHYIDPEKVEAEKEARKAKKEEKTKKRRERNVSSNT